MSNGYNLEPELPSHAFWLCYYHWLNSVNRWQGYVDRYDSLNPTTHEVEMMTLEVLMLDETYISMYWEHIVNTYWRLWRN